MRMACCSSSAARRWKSWRSCRCSVKATARSAYRACAADSICSAACRNREAVFVMGRLLLSGGIPPGRTNAGRKRALGRPRPVRRLHWTSGSRMGSAASGLLREAVLVLDADEAQRATALVRHGVGGLGGHADHDWLLLPDGDSDLVGQERTPGVPVLVGRDVHEDDHAGPPMVVGHLDLARIDRDREDADLLVLVDDLVVPRPG